MTRILVQRGPSGSSSSNQNRPSTAVPVSAPAPSSSSGSSSSNQNRSSTSVPVSAPAASSSSASSDLSQHKDADSVQVVPAVTDENMVEEVQDYVSMNELSESSCVLNGKGNENQSEDLSPGSVNSDQLENVNIVDDKVLLEDAVGRDSLRSVLAVIEEENDETVGSSFQMVNNSLCPPPPPVPPPMDSNSWRFGYNDSNAMRIGSPRRAAGWSGVSSRSPPNGSRPSSPRSHGEGEGYNSADEHSPCFSSSYDAEREHQFEIDLRRVKGLDVRKMQEDGNCLFRAVADQVYGDSEVYDLVRQMCIDYMERERDHFSQFVTEGFTSYCKRKRRDKVYGNNLEIQAMSEMYNSPIHIYSYSAEPFNIFHGSYNTDTPPIRISYHHGNHYNSLIDPRRLTIGAGLGFSSLKGRNVDKDQVKAAIKAQQDQQIDSALLAEGRFYSDLELTEKEIERMVMEASRAEYLADDRFKQQLGRTESLTSKAEPSSSAARSSAGSDLKQKAGREISSAGSVLNDSMQIMLSMGFSYLQVIEASSIFGDDVDSMVGYLLDTSSGGRRKGKVTE